MSALDDLLRHGVSLVHAGLCPACEMIGVETRLQAAAPDGFHYHGEAPTDPPYLWCPVDGQGYRIVQDEMRILPPCNGGLHADGTVGYR